MHAVVAHEEVPPFGILRGLYVFESRAVAAHVGLDQPLAVDVDDAVSLLPRFAGQPDEPLDESAARAALRSAAFGVLKTMMSPRAGSRRW